MHQDDFLKSQKKMLLNVAGIILFLDIVSTMS